MSSSMFKGEHVHKKERYHAFKYQVQQTECQSLTLPSLKAFGAMLERVQADRTCVTAALVQARAQRWTRADDVHYW
eukprot:3581496-Pleurochrysis_carterae.AAC.2